MDSLRYQYPRDGSGYLSSNRLTQVLDSIAGDPYTEDISGQEGNNYIYDNIGNLVTNVRDSVTNIKWTVYGKINSVTKSDGSSLEYRYDASGNRVYKAYTHGGVTDKTWYVRDAQGNTLAIYGNKDGDANLYWKEQQLYGSSRLGIWKPNTLVSSDVSAIWNTLGLKRYELSNHLGNVLATVSDKAVQVGDHYISEVLSAQDYYPFGMLQPDRRYSLGSYRYGFNGKENDNEVKGEGNQQDYGMRVYDPRIGKFLSVDPLTKDYPWYTPYQFAGNKPIKYIDLDGAEPAEAESPGAAMRPVLGGLRTPSAMAQYTRYGLSPGGFAYETNPLSTVEQIKAHEEYMREQYLLSNVYIKGIWVPRFEDEVRDLRIKRAISSLDKFNERNRPPLLGFSNLSLPSTAPLVGSNLSEARILLGRALSRQGLDRAPGGFKEQWSEGDYDYLVRIHGPKENAPLGSNSATNTVLRVSRRLRGSDSNNQGHGWEYADDNNNWYKEKDLKAGRNEQAANDTHIPLNQ